MNLVNETRLQTAYFFFFFFFPPAVRTSDKPQRVHGADLCAIYGLPAAGDSLLFVL